MSPIDAVKREVEIELDALARRIGSSPPFAVTIRVELDRETGLPRTVDCYEERKRRILGPGGSSPSRCVLK